MKMLIKIDSVKHGEEIPGKLGRWCKVHGSHGRFFLCPEYPDQVLAKIKKEEHDFLRSSMSYWLLVIFALLLIFSALR